MYLKSNSILEKTELDANLSVGEIAGFNVDTSALTFGTIALNTTSRRSVVIRNDYDFPIKVEFSVEGDIEEFLIFDKIIFLDVGESKGVEISTKSISDDTPKYYSGKFIAVVRKSWKDI